MKTLISLGLFVAAIQTSAADQYSFASQSQDNMTSTIYLRARYYDPEIGRFLTKDPIGIQGGVNLYQYAFANPINFVDPLGEDALTHVFGGVKTVGGVLEIAVGGSFGIASSWTGIGGVAGGVVVLHGIDTTQSGFRQMISGEVVDSFTSMGLQSVGVPATGANLIDAGVGVVGTGGLGVYSGVTKVAAASQLPEAAGMTSWQIALAIEKGSKALPKPVFDALGGQATSALAKAAMIEQGAVAGTSGINIGVSLSLAKTGLTPLGDIGAGVIGSNLIGGSGAFNLYTSLVRDQSGVLIDKAAELVGSNLADIKGATYDPVSNQIIFLGSNSTPGVEGIDMDYFYTAVQAVYGSAIPPYVSLDAPASAASLWQDYGDGDGSFEAGEWGGFSMRYNPLWAEEDGNVAVRVKCRIGATNYDFNVNFTPQTISWLQYPNGQRPMHLVYSSITGTAPPGISVWTGPFTTLPFPQTALDLVNTSSNVNGGQDWTYPFQLYNGGSGAITNISFAVIPDRQHRRFGGRLEGTKLGWVLQEADRIMKCLAIGTDNVTGATYTSATVPIAGYKNLAEINAAGTSVSGNTRVWFLADQMKLKRHVDSATGRATIVFDQAVVGVKTESALNFQAQSPGVAAFAGHLQTNFDAFAAIPSDRVIKY